jgi:uncharacterized protein with ATP-grasp and redox domains
MATKIDLTDDLARIAKDLEQALKDIIIQEGLVDTGRLRDSVKISIRGNEIDISVEDYFKYLDNDYKLTEQFENSKAFDVAVKRLQESIAQDILKNID